MLCFLQLINYLQATETELDNVSNENVKRQISYSTLFLNGSQTNAEKINNVNINYH